MTRDPDKLRAWQRMSKPLARGTTPMKRGKGIDRGGKPLERKVAMSRGKGIKWRPKAEGIAFWVGQALACKTRDGGRCRRCGLEFDVLAAAHVVPLGSGSSRYRASDPRNAVGNLVSLCFPHHRAKDELHEFTWASIGVVVDPVLALKYGYVETIRKDVV